MSTLDRTVDDIERAVQQWRARHAIGLPDAAALLDLTIACEWLLQQEAVMHVRRDGRRRGRGALGVLIVVTGLGVLAVIGLALAWLALQVAP